MKTIFTFPSKDGRTNIHAVQWVPDDGQFDAILQITHGMVEFIERYTPFAEYLIQNRFMVVGHDHLGHGDSVVSKEDWGYFAPGDPSSLLVEDMHQLRKIIQEKHPGTPYFMLGHSMGSYLLRRYLSVHGEGLNGAIIMGTGYVEPSTARMGSRVASALATLKGWRHRSMMVSSLAFGKSYQQYDMTGKDPSRSWLTKDVKIVKWYYNEPRCTYLFTLNGYKGLFDTVSYTCQQENVNRIPKDLPVFIVSGGKDPVGDAGTGVKKVNAMFQEAGIKDLSMKLYPDDYHEILNELDKQTVFSDLLQWMTDRLHPVS